MKNSQYPSVVRAAGLVSLGLVLALGAAGSASSVESKVKIFSEAPSPRELANILYPPRYRAIVLNGATERAEEEPEAFGLLINFEFDSTKIVQSSRTMLDSVGEMMRSSQLQGRAVVIEGHTDALGAPGYNHGLSDRRARAVKRYLMSIYGVESDRLVVEAKGETALHDRRNPANPVNRRVQFRAYNGG